MTSVWPRLLVWAAAGSVVVCGCVTGPPSLVRIQAPNRPAIAQAVAELPASLNVTTFNVWGLPGWLNGASSERYPRIAKELDQSRSDVVLLQEVWTHRSFADLSQPSKGCACAWWTASARHKGSFLGQNGLLTLSRFPIAGAEVRYFSKASLPDSLMNKGALKITIALATGQRINIWNVHLQDDASAKVRSSQLAELIRWIDEAHDNQAVDIVGGDFNFTPDMEEFSRLVAAIGPDVHQLANDKAFPTWDGLKLSSKASQTLDHIFVRRRQPGDEVAASSRKIFAAARREDRLSDHMGMEALLTFRNPLDHPQPILAAQRNEEDHAESALLTSDSSQKTPGTLSQR